MMDEAILNDLISMPTSNQQSKTMQYLEELKKSDAGWQLCVEALTAQYFRDDTIRFFLLQVIENYVKTKYLHASAQQQTMMRQFLNQWATCQFGSVDLPSHSAFIRNKIAQIFALVFLVDYPMRWPTFFDDLMLSIMNGNKSIDNYLRVLLAIDLEIADREISRTAQEMERNGNLKDTMRQKDVGELVNSWYHILVNCRDSSPSSVCLCMQVIGKYVQWIDLSLIANNRFMDQLYKFFSFPSLRVDAVDCFNEIISKGMDPWEKVKLIELTSMYLNQGCWKELCPEMSQIVSNEEDTELYRVKLAKLVNTIGSSLIECFSKMTKNTESSAKYAPYLDKVKEAIDSKVDLMMMCFAHCQNDVSLAVLDFVKDYLHIIKLKISQTENERIRLEGLLCTISKQLCFFKGFNFDSEGEKELNFSDYRKQLKVIFDNVAQIDKNLVIEKVQTLLNKAMAQWKMLDYETVESALFMFYNLGEAVHTGGTSWFTPDLEKTSPIQMMISQLVHSDLSCHPHPAVIVQYFEIIVRYEKFFCANTDCIVPVLSSFLRDNGMYHNSKRVRSRCAYLFSRFVKCIRGSLTPELTQEILTVIGPLLTITCESDNSPTRLISEADQYYLYEVVGVLIVAGERNQQQKSEFMKQVVSPLLENCKSKINQYSSEKDPKNQDAIILMISQSITVTARLSKAFSNQQNMKSCGCNQIFLEALQVFLFCLNSLEGEHLSILQGSVRQYLHRMVVCLEEELLPYIPISSQSLLKNCDSKCIQDYIPLINQVICKFKLSWVFQKEITPFLQQMFAPMVQSVFSALAVPIEANDQQAVRDRQLLQRQYYQFISTVASNNVSEVFNCQDPVLLQQVMQSVLQGSVELPDPVSQKFCFCILKKFVEMWASENGPEGFVDYMYKSIVPACMMAPMRQTFELNDAQALLALSEIALCLSTIYEKRKGEFVLYLQNHYFANLDVPSEKTHEFIQALQCGPKHFKSFLKTFYQQAKS